MGCVAFSGVLSVAARGRARRPRSMISASGGRTRPPVLLPVKCTRLVRSVPAGLCCFSSLNGGVWERRHGAESRGVHLTLRAGWVARSSTFTFSRGWEPIPCCTEYLQYSRQSHTLTEGKILSLYRRYGLLEVRQGKQTSGDDWYLPHISNDSTSPPLSPSPLPSR